MDAENRQGNMKSTSPFTRGGPLLSVMLQMNKVSEAQKLPPASSPFPPAALKMLIHHSTVASRLL